MEGLRDGLKSGKFWSTSGCSMTDEEEDRGRRRQLKGKCMFRVMFFIYKIGVSSKFDVSGPVIVFLNWVNSVIFFLTVYKIRIPNLVIYHVLFLPTQLSLWRQ